MDSLARGTNFQQDTVHTAYNYPSYSSFPFADQQVQTLDGGALANYGAYPFLYADRAEGPPPTMKCGATGARYSTTNGMWYCPTAPCLGPRPHDRAYCDIQSGRWTVPTISGQQTPLDDSLVQMDQCGFDSRFPPAIGTRGTVECDLKTGRNYYDGSNGAYYYEDYTGMQDVRSYYDPHREGRAGLGVINSSSAYSHPKIDPAVSLDRAYSGFHSKGVPFTDGRGRLHPAQTAVSMANHRTRGYMQRNPNVHPVASRQAVAYPKQLRAGYMSTSMTGSEMKSAAMLSPFTPSSFAAVNQIYLRPGAGQLLERSATIHRNAHQ